MSKHEKDGESSRRKRWSRAVMEALNSYKEAELLTVTSITGTIKVTHFC
jgi:hypothetical protein